MPGSTPSPANYSNIVDELVTQQFMRTEWEQTKKIRIFTETLEKDGAFEYDASGKWTDWKARIGEYTTAYHNDLGVRSFARKNHYVTYTAPWAMIEVTGVLSENDVMFMNSPDAVVNLTKKMLKQMSEDFYKDVNKKLLQENGGSSSALGAATFAGAQVPFYGMPTLFGYGTSTGYNPDTQASTGTGTAAGDKEALPTVTYCGVATHPTSAIAGVDNKMNESTTPVIANWSSTAWNTAAVTTWLVNAVDVMEHLVTRCTRGSGIDETPNLSILTQKMYREFRASIRRSSAVQIVLSDDSPRSPDAGMYPRRFIPFLGVNAFYDENQLSNVVGVYNTKQMKFRMFPQKPAGMDSGAIGGDVKEMFKVSQMPDIDQGGHKVVVKMVGQLMQNPRYQGVAYALA